MSEVLKEEGMNTEKTVSADQEIACPFCGETISIMDEVCPHCDVSVAGDDEISDDFDLDAIFPSQKRNVTSIVLEVLAYVVAAVFLLVLISYVGFYLPQILKSPAGSEKTGYLIQMFGESAKYLFYGVIGFGVLKGLSFLTDDNY